jgi:hypothetical protein
MLRQFSFAVLAAAVAAGTGLAAQAGSTSSPSSATQATQPSSSASPSTSSSASASTANHVTVTGCIERADEMTSSAKNPTADPDSLQYVLVRPEPEHANGSPSSAPVGTTGTADNSRVMYRLSGDQQKLNPHVGHKVEITGTPSTMTASTAAAASAPMPAGPAPGLMVENVRMLDATCTAAK